MNTGFQAVCNLFIFDEAAGWISKGFGRVNIVGKQLYFVTSINGQKILVLNHLTSGDITLNKSKDNDNAWVYRTKNVTLTEEEKDVVVALAFRDLRTATELETYFYADVDEISPFHKEDSGSSSYGSLLTGHNEISAPVSKGFKAHNAFTRKGYIHGRKKENQDALISHYDESSGAQMYGVLDGHGPVGQIVSGYFKEFFPDFFFKHHEFPHNIPQALRDSIATVEQNMLKTNPDLNSLSGSTAVICVIYENVLYTANVGDSRAVVGSEVNEDDVMSAEILTTDHKPNNPAEKSRILRCGGRVSTVDPADPTCPSRVYAKNEVLPGLAMSRSIGDILGKTCGVISTPDITERMLGPKDYVLILGTDGVWDFMDADEAIEIAKELASDPYLACQKIVDLCQLRWRAEEVDYIDDTSVILAYINQDSFSYSKVSAV